MTAKVKNEFDFSVVASSDDLAPVQKMIQACIQCGTCTGTCPNEFAMDHTPRHLWRLILAGRKEEIFQSQTFTLCSACYSCTLRCPRGLPLTEAMGALKQVAARDGLSKHRESIFFYKSFLESVRRHGRVREIEFMSLYFNAMKNPLLPLRFAGLGTKLLRKRKVPLQIPSKGDGKLAALFRKTAELQEAP